MGVLAWILLGLVAGFVAKLIVPGRNPGGVMVTILIGLVGAWLGHYVASRLGFNTMESFDLLGIVIATVGAAIIMLVFRLFRRE